MSPESKAKELGVSFQPLEPGYLNLCIRSGNLLLSKFEDKRMQGQPLRRAHLRS